MIQEHKTLELSSIMENVHQVEALIEEVCEDFNLNNTYLGCITVAVTEAFENAVNHGNNNDPSKKVIVNFQKTSSGLAFSVKDEGKGFDWRLYVDDTRGKSAVEKARRRHQQGKLGGLGIMLMTKCTERIEYNEQGYAITLYKYLNPQPKE